MPEADTGVDLGELRSRIERVYVEMTESRSPHGAISWFAERAGVQPKTVSRWLTGDHSPSGPALSLLRELEEKAGLAVGSESGAVHVDLLDVVVGLACLALAAGLIFGSVYLNSGGEGWTEWEAQADTGVLVLPPAEVEGPEEVPDVSYWSYEHLRRQNHLLKAKIRCAKQWADPEGVIFDNLRMMRAACGLDE